MSEVGADVAAVVVDYHADAVLGACVDSLFENGVTSITVVENGDSGSVDPAFADRGVTVISPGVNLGYGRGVNRGAAVDPTRTFLLVSNPDVTVHDGAVRALVRYLDENADVALVGPTILRTDGSVYPSVRVFPDVVLAGTHALLSPIWPNNPATRRYRSPRRDGSPDWVSGAFFLIRRSAFEQVGGFDERYFMFAEDMALCWQLGQRGWRVATTPEAVVTHVEGVSRARAPRSMVLAHHRSAFRFELQTARGWRRVFVPIALVVLSLRLAIVLATSPKS